MMVHWLNGTYEYINWFNCTCCPYKAHETEYRMSTLEKVYLVCKRHIQKSSILHLLYRLWVV